MKKIFKIAVVAALVFIVVFILNQQSITPPPQNSTVENETLGKNVTSYPIVFVHGWMGKAIDYQEYGIKLDKEGIGKYMGLVEADANISICTLKWPNDTVVSAGYYTEANKDTGIAEYAKELNHAIELIRACTGSEQVILVAHSMGGLVSRKYMADYGDLHVKKLITLATPHYGFNVFTRGEIILMMLRLFTGRENEVEEMRPNSDFLQALDKADISYREKMVSIGTYSSANKTLAYGLPVFQSEILNFEKQRFNNSDVIVKLDSTKLAGTKYYQIEGCSHTEFLNFRNSYPKGPINNPNTCLDAYYIVKKEILLS